MIKIFIKKIFQKAFTKKIVGENLKKIILKIKFNLILIQTLFKIKKNLI